MTFGLVLFIVFVIFSAIIGIAAQLGEKRRLAESGIAEIDVMDGITFERYLEVLFGNLGYSVQRTQASGDFGADLIIKKGGERTVVQAKRYSKNVGLKAVQEVEAAKKMYLCATAIVVTNSGYTKQAIRLAKMNNVELWDREKLIAAILSTKKQASFMGSATPTASVSGTSSSTPEISGMQGLHHIREGSKWNTMLNEAKNYHVKEMSCSKCHATNRVKPFISSVKKPVCGRCGFPLFLTPLLCFAIASVNVILLGPIPSFG